MDALSVEPRHKEEAPRLILSDGPLVPGFLAVWFLMVAGHWPDKGTAIKLTSKAGFRFWRTWRKSKYHVDLWTDVTRPSSRDAFEQREKENFFCRLSVMPSRPASLQVRENPTSQGRAQSTSVHMGKRRGPKMSQLKPLELNSARVWGMGNGRGDRSPQSHQVVSLVPWPN